MMPSAKFPASPPALRFDLETPVPERSRTAWFWFGAALVLLFFVRPLYIELGEFDLENDEAIYSHAVLSVVEAGQWGSPWSSPGSMPFLEKPPLKFWIVALGQLTFLPSHELGMRFFDPLFGGIALLYLFALGRRVGGAIAGLGAVATLFLFEPLLFEHGLRANTMESMLILAYCGGAWHFLAWRASAPGSRPSRWHFLAASLFFTCGFQVKFVAALFLPAVAGLCALLFPDTRRRLRSELPLLLGAAGLFVLLTAPWFVYQHFVHRELFWQTVFGQHVVQRFTQHLDPQHVQPFSHYFTTITRRLSEAGTLPFVAGGLACWLFATWRGRSFVGVFSLLWVFLPLLAISFGTSKLVHYTYPFLPPLGLFAGFGLSRLIQPELWRRRPWELGLFTLLALWLLPPTFHAYQRNVEAMRHGDHRLRDLANCLGRGTARTLVDEGHQLPLVFVHAFLSDGIYHPIAFYSRQGAEMQQLDLPDDRLLFFRLYVPPHQAATVIPVKLMDSFRENMRDPAFRQNLREMAAELGAEAETEALLADAENLPQPPGFRMVDTLYLLPGPYAACLPPSSL